MPKTTKRKRLGFTRNNVLKIKIKVKPVIFKSSDNCVIEREYLSDRST